MWVEFIAPFDWTPPLNHRRLRFAYSKGSRVCVTRSCAQAAVAAGAAKLITPPSREKRVARYARIGKRKIPIFYDGSTGGP